MWQFPGRSKICLKDVFTLEDWLELPDAETEGRMGTYVFVVVEDETIEGIRGIEYKNSGSNQDTQRTGNMVKQYGVTSARKTSTRKNSVYLCSGGEEYRTRVSQSSGRLFIIMLETLEKPVFSNRYVRPIAWSFVEEIQGRIGTVSYTHLRAHETGRNLVCRLLLEKKKKK